MATGALRYFTGKACPHGHVCERYVKTMQCVECVVGYAAKWKAENPAGIKAIQRRSNARRDPQTVKTAKAASQKRNRASANKRQQRYVEANRSKVNAASMKWAKANPAMGAAKTRRRQADQLQRTPAWADNDAILVKYKLAAAFRELGLPYEVDHEIPLRGKLVSGLHVHDNLQIINATRNKQKSNHF